MQGDLVLIMILVRKYLNNDYDSYLRAYNIVEYMVFDVFDKMFSYMLMDRYHAILMFIFFWQFYHIK